MTQDDTIQPLAEEQPVHYAERLGTLYAQSMESQVKKDRGQFFTPREIANYMRQMVEAIQQDEVRILAPGCGLGILSVALVEQIPGWKSKPEIIHFEPFDTDRGTYYDPLGNGIS